MTIENIMNKCGQSLIKPSVVSAPMDFLTTEAEYIRVWQVRIARAENCKLYGQYGRACASWVQVYSKRHRRNVHVRLNGLRVKYATRHGGFGIRSRGFR